MIFMKKRDCFTFRTYVRQQDQLVSNIRLLLAGLETLMDYFHSIDMLWVDDVEIVTSKNNANEVIATARYNDGTVAFVSKWAFERVTDVDKFMFWNLVEDQQGFQQMFASIESSMMDDDPEMKHIDNPAQATVYRAVWRMINNGIRWNQFI